MVGLLAGYVGYSYRFFLIFCLEIESLFLDENILCICLVLVNCGLVFLVLATVFDLRLVQSMFDTDVLSQTGTEYCDLYLNLVYLCQNWGVDMVVYERSEMQMQ
jgi:hypothetical protein